MQRIRINIGKRPSSLSSWEPDPRVVRVRTSVALRQLAADSPENSDPGEVQLSFRAPSPGNPIRLEYSIPMGLRTYEDSTRDRVDRIEGVQARRFKIQCLRHLLPSLYCQNASFKKTRIAVRARTRCASVQEGHQFGLQSLFLRSLLLSAASCLHRATNLHGKYASACLFCCLQTETRSRLEFSGHEAEIQRQGQGPFRRARRLTVLAW